MIHKPLTVGASIAIAVGVFLVTAVLESIINIWVFKRMGGCPLAGPKAGDKGCNSAKKHTGRQLVTAEPVIAVNP